MATLQELREQRETLFKQAEAFEAQDKAGTLDAAMTEQWVATLDQIKGLDEQIDKASAVQQASESARERMNQTRTVTHTGRRTAPEGATANEVKVGKQRIEDDPRKGFKSFGEFASLVRNAQTPGNYVRDDRMNFLNAISGMGTVDGAGGGFLVPEEFSTAIWDGANQQSDSLLARTDQYPISGESLELLANAETSRANGSRWGGVRGYWLAEGDQMTASRPKFRKLKLEPKTLACMAWVTDKLLALSPVSLESYLTRAFQDEINFKIGDAIINGTGAGTPKGILTGTAGTTSSRVSVTKEGGQAAATIVYANVLKAYARLHPRAMTGAIWLYNVGITPSLNQMTISVGTGGAPVYVPPGGASATPYGTLMGLPLVPCEFCAAPGTEGDLILTNLNWYAAGVRGGVRSASSMHLGFDYNQTAFRALIDVDGQPWLESAITPFKGSDTQSATVTIATRA